MYARTGFNFSADDMKERPILTYHRMIEAFNFVAAKETYLADPRFSDKTDEVGNNFQVARKRVTRQGPLPGHSPSLSFRCTMRFTLLLFAHPSQDRRPSIGPLLIFVRLP